MNAAHVHLILNHFPIAGMIFSLPLLVASAWRKNTTLGIAGLSGVVGTGLVSIPTYLTGEPSEEIVEHLPGVSEQLIHAHEETAEKAIIVVGVTAILALTALIFYFKKKSLPSWIVPVVTACCLFSAGFLAWTNNLGGRIRHAEIRDAAVSNLETED